MDTPNIKVKTQFGTLIAEASPDPDYRAIWLTLIDETVVYQMAWRDEPTHIIAHELEQGFMS